MSRREPLKVGSQGCTLTVCLVNSNYILLITYRSGERSCRNDIGTESSGAGRNIDNRMRVTRWLPECRGVDVARGGSPCIQKLGYKRISW